MKKLAIYSVMLIVILPVSLWSQLPFAEDFSDGTSPAGWTFPSNWQVGSVGYAGHPIGNPPPGAFFYWSPAVQNYSERMTSPMISVGQAEQVQVFFDMALDFYSPGGLEGLAIEYQTSGGSWVEALSYEIFAGTSVDYPLSTKAYIASVTDSIQLGFRAYGLNSFNINSWDIDNIRVEHILPATQLGSDIDGEAAGDYSGCSVSMNSAGNRVAIGAWKNSGYTGHVRIYEYSNSSWTQLGSDIDAEAVGDYSGISVSMNSAGNRVAIGAINNDGTGINAGHVRVYEYSNSSWTQLGSDIDGEAADDRSGRSVSIDYDGDRVAIGAYQNDGTGTSAGHVRIYEYSNSSWTQLGSDIDGEAADDQSGWSVSINSAGDRVAIGAWRNDGTGGEAGHVRVYEYINSSWTQLGSDIDGEAAGDYSGYSVSINSAGDVVAIGAYENDGTGSDAGHARVYEYSSGSWTQLGSDIDSEAAFDRSGRSVSMDSDGNRVAIGADGNSGTGSEAGHVRVYEYSSGSWNQLGGDMDGEAAGDYSGYSVSMDSDGDRVAIGAFYNDGTGSDAGHVRVYSLANPVQTVQTTTYVPDDNFEQALIDLGYDDVLNDSVLTANISGVTTLNVSNDSISDLTGIENFTALTNLDCSYNQLTSLDVNSNTVLTDLKCSNNQLTSLDVSNTLSLELLELYENDLTSLDVSNNTALNHLVVSHNQLDSLDVSNNTALTRLECNDNQLTTMDVTNNNSLEIVELHNNSLTSFAGISNKLNLTRLKMRHNEITSVDLGGCVSLTNLDMNNNNLTSINVSGCVSMTLISASSNELTTIDLSINDSLTWIGLFGNQLTSIDVSDKPNLGRLSIFNNELTSLNVDNNPLLNHLHVSSNQLTSLDVSNNSNLGVLHCGNNQLTYLNMKNGVTDQLTNFNATSNDSLECIETLDPDYATANWTYENGNIDDGVTFSEICSGNPNDTYVPDDNFEQALIDLGYDDVLNDSVLTANISGVTTLNVNNDSISDLTGIEDFIALTYLSCSYNQLTSLDVSANTALTNLSCGDNQLTSLDVSSNTALTSLSCHHNQLTSLDVSSNTALTFLNCGSNPLDSLDVSSNTALTSLYCGDNQLTSLDISNNTALTNLYCPNNQLTSLDISNNTALTQLHCYYNNLDNLDVSNHTALTYLSCSDNQLDSLDVSAITGLYDLSCSNNQLTSLDVSNNTALTQLYCAGNQLTSLDVSNNTALTRLICGHNDLTILDVSNNTALTSLFCRNNQLTSLDVSNNTFLTSLFCNNNQLDSLDVSNHTALTWLECQANELTYLNMKNGVTDQLTNFNATSNDSLECIETLDPDYATTNWTSANGNIDEGVTFAVDCTPEPPTLDPPTLVINELLAQNISCCTDANGDYDGYIELFNYGDEAVDISGLFITDQIGSYEDYHQIPTGNDSTIIQPGGFLLLWADEESEQGVLHVEFELNARVGGVIGLFMPDSTTVVDNITYGSQSDDDVAYGRYPDSSATWQFMNPTPGATNAGGLSLNDNIVIPSQYTLHQNYPNPFNPVTTLRYDLPENGHINITIYDMLGRQVRTLISQTQNAGYKSVIWDATNDYGKPVTAGIYIYQIQAVGFIQTKKMLLLK